MYIGRSREEIQERPKDVRKKCVKGGVKGKRYMTSQNAKNTGMQKHQGGRWSKTTNGFDMYGEQRRGF